MHYIVSVERKEDAEELERLYCCEEVILCKECKFWVEESYPYSICDLNKRFTNETQWCCWAERKEE